MVIFTESVRDFYIIFDAYSFRCSFFLFINRFKLNSFKYFGLKYLDFILFQESKYYEPKIRGFHFRWLETMLDLEQYGVKWMIKNCLSLQ